MKRAILILISLVSTNAQAQKDFTERIDISGFARLVGGMIADDDVTFIGYDDSISSSDRLLK